MTPKEQALRLIKESSSIGIALPETPTIDDAASFFALSRVFSKLNKRAGLIFSGTFPDLLYEILPRAAFDRTNENTAREFIIEINHRGSPVKELRYEREDDALNIVLTPKDRSIKKEDIAFREGRQKYDLIIALGVHTLENIGKVLEESPDIFYEKPVIAIDTSPSHDAFGEVTLVDEAMSSVSEIAADLILALSQDSVDERSATALLLGIIAKTKNLQNGRANPSTFSTAAELVKRGAKKEEIVRVLWKTKPLPMLQIWGRASVRSRMDAGRSILWSVLTKDDFVKTATEPKDAVPFVIDHIEEHFALPDFFALLWQEPEDNNVRAMIRTLRSGLSDDELAPFGAKEHCRILKSFFPSFVDAEGAVLSLLSRSSMR